MLRLRVVKEKCFIMGFNRFWCIQHYLCIQNVIDDSHDIKHINVSIFANICGDEPALVTIPFWFENLIDNLHSIQDVQFSIKVDVTLGSQAPRVTQSPDDVGWESAFSSEIIASSMHA